MNKTLQELLAEQEQLNKSIQQSLQSGGGNPGQLEQENQRLKALSEQQLASIETLQSSLRESEQALEKSRLQLKEALMNERNQLLNHYQNRLLELLNGSAQLNRQRLVGLRQQVLQQCTAMEKDIQLHLDQFKGSALDDIQTLRNSITLNANEQLQIIDEALKTTSEETIQEVSKIRQEPLPDKPVSPQPAVFKKESRLGLKVFNYIGIFFIFLAIVSIGLYSINSMTDTLKGLLIFVIGALLFAIGEFTRRRGNEVFSWGLIGGGIGIFYIGVYINYFVLETFSIQIAFIILLVICLLSMGLTLFYKRLPIALITLIGAYLPLISYVNLIGITASSLYGVQFYLVIVNLMMLTLFNSFKWKSLWITSFICFTPWIFLLLSYSNFALIPSLLIEAIYLGLFTLYPIIQIQRQKLEPSSTTVYIALYALSFAGLASFALISRSSLLVGSLIQIIFIAVMVYLFKILTTVQSLPKASALLIVIFNLYCLYLVAYFIPYLHTRIPELRFIGIVLLITMNQFIHQRFPEQRAYLGTSFALQIFFYLSCFSLGTQLIDFTIGSAFAYLLIAGIGLMLTLHFLPIKHPETIDKWKMRSLSDLINIQNFLGFLFGYFLLFLSVSYLLSLHFFRDPNELRRMLIVLDLTTATLYTYFYSFHEQNPKRFFSLLATIPLALFTLINSAQPIILNVNKTSSVLLLIVSIVNGLLILILIARQLRYLYDQKLQRISMTVLSGEAYLAILVSVMAHANIDSYALPVILDCFYAILAIICVYLGFRTSSSGLRKTGLGIMLAVIAKLFLLDIGAVTLPARILAFLTFGILSLLISYGYQRISRNLEQKIKEAADHTDPEQGA